MWLIQNKEGYYFSKIDKELFYMLGTGVILAEGIIHAMKFKTKEEAKSVARNLHYYTKNNYTWKIVKEK